MTDPKKGERCRVVDRLGVRCKTVLDPRNTSGLCVVHLNVGKHSRQDPLTDREREPSMWGKPSLWGKS